MFIERAITPYLRHLLGLDVARCLLLTGARQTGKTTLLRREFPSFAYYSLDEPLEREAILRRPSRWWLAQGSRFIFDEVQKAPDFFGTIKAMIDNGPPELRIILSGSAQIRLMTRIRESLAGRAVRVELFPFHTVELSRGEARLLRGMLSGEQRSGIAGWLTHLSHLSPGDPRLLAVQEAQEQLLGLGGMPPVHVLSTVEEKWLWLKEYCGTYLQRDLMDLGRIADLDNFLRLERLAAMRSGGIINYADMARDADISAVTAKRYINYLEISYHCFLLRAFRRRRKERLIKASKLYFTDLGIQRVLSGLKTGLTGEQFETYVIAEVIKFLAILNSEAQGFYLRTKDGREVDLLLQTEQGYWAMEIKHSRNPGPRAARHLRGLEAYLDGPLLGGFVVTSGGWIKELGPDVWTIPSWALWY